MRYAELFDGTVLEFPDQTPDEVITRVAQEETAKRRPPPAPLSTERSGKEAFTDIGAALVSGTGKMLAFPGQFVSLIPGLRGVGTALASPGEALAQVGEGLKSQGLKVREALRSEAISEAEKDGILSEFATAITSTIKDPALISTFVTEQLPNFLPPALIGRLVGKLGVSAIKGLTGEAAEQAVTQAQRRAVGAAIGTGAVMQSSDIGSEAYRRAYEAAVAQGKTPEEAEAEANSAARIAAGGAFGTSLVAQRLPGARAIEQRLAKVPGTSGRLAGGLGEATSETLEEAGGQLFQNIGVRTVDPTQSLTQGVGAAAGLGLLGGGFFGTLLSKKAAPEPLPGQLPGETLEQSISRLVSQREQLKEPPVPKDIISDEDVIRLAGTLNDQGQPIGYGLLTQYEERLKQLPESPEQQRALEVASSVKERLNIESIQRQQNAYSNIITYKDMKDLGFSETDPLYESLVGKNLGIPDEATQVLSALNNELGKEIPSERRELVGVMLESAQSFLDQVPGSAFYAERKPRADLRGDGAGAEVSGQRRQPAPEEPLPSEAAGLAVPESGAGQPDAREAEEQRPLRFETSAGQVDLRESGDPVDNSGPILYASPEDVQKIRQDIQDPKNTYQVGYAQSFETGDMFTPVTSLAEIPAGAPAYVATVQRATGNIINSYPASTIPEAGSIPVQKRYKPGLSTINIGEPITRVLTDKDIVTPKMLEELGIKKQSAVAKRILGKEVKSPEVKRELSKRSLREEVAPEEEKAAPEVAAEAEGPSPKEQIDAINRQLESLMKRLLNQYGLKDIEVKIVKDLQAKGEFSGRLIKLADDTDNPLLDLKHEAVHALKELGFFTRGQWETLKNRASQEWIQTYLKDTPYTDTVSRYDAYKSMFEAEGKSPQEVEEALIEEAIADAFSFYAKTRPPSGLLSAINTRLKNLFKALKEFLTQSEMSAEDIFGRIEEGKLPSKAEVRTAESEVKKSLVTGVPRSTRAIMESSTPFAQAELGLRTERPKGATGANNVRDIARALNEQTIANFGGMTRNDLSAANANDLARALADEVGYQLRATATTGTGLGWYSNNYPRALDKLAVRFPELKTNKTARSVFTACVAVSSNGEDVSTNIKNAILMYEDVRDGREIRDIGARRADALNNNKAQITALLDRYGDNFTAELLKTTTVKDMNAQLRAMGEDTDSSYLANTTVPIAAIYFGPKLGAFYANLMGAEGYLTMDMWWTRTMNRMRGLLMPSATNSSIAKFREMMGKKENEISREDVVNATQEWRDRYEAQGYETDLEMLVGAKEPAKKAELPEWTRKARGRAGPAFEQLEFDHRAQKMANTIWKNEREMLQEAPFTGTDRAFMYKVARDAQKILKQEGIDLSLADIQAAIWYYEKRLYAKLSGRIADDIGYDEAITRSSAAAGPAGPSVVFPDKPNGGYVPPRQGADVDQVRGEPEAVREEPAEVKRSLRAPRSPLGFYSELENKVADMGPNQAPPAQWKTMIKALPQKGVKPEEIEWSGVNDWLDLQEGKVKKDDLINYLRANGVQVEEVVLGGSRRRGELRIEYSEPSDTWSVVDEESNVIESGMPDLDAAEAVLEGLNQEENVGTKYGTYTLPGGENYREILLTLPQKQALIEPPDTSKWTVITKQTSPSGARQVQIRDDQGNMVGQRFGFQGSDEDAIKEVLPGFLEHRLQIKQNETNYRSSHWDQPNVLAHIRINDRTDAGGNKVLFVEEIQSDWGQEGKRKGFASKLRDEEIEKKLLFKTTSDGDGFNVYTDDGRMVGSGETRSEALANAIRGYRVAEQGIPSAPFVTKTEGWLNLALKRIMIMAAEGDYDKVAFTTGAQNAERFSLDKQLSEIAYEPAGDGLYEIAATDLQGREVISEDEVTLNRIEELVGKEIAEKVARDEGERDEDGYRDWRYLRGDNLKVEAKGMRAFYDTIVPTALKKLLPKVGGGQMGKVQMERGKPDRAPVDATPFLDWMGVNHPEVRRVDAARAWSMGIDNNSYVQEWFDTIKGMTQPGFDVTPAMREKVAEGLPKFSLRAPETKAFKQWFGDSKVVDANGNPLVVYHGMPSEMVGGEFRESTYGTLGPGIYFTSDPDIASNFATGKRYPGMQEKLQGSVVPVYLKMESPFDDEFFVDNQAWQQWAASLIRNGHDAKNENWPYYARWRIGSIEESESVLRALHDKLTNGQATLKDMVYYGDIETPYGREFIKEIKQHGGFDGFILKNSPKGFDEYVVFKPNQIKSAIGNVGTFDISSPDIRRSLRSQTAWTDKRIDSLLSSFAYLQSSREGDAKAYAARITPRDFLNATADDTLELRIADETKTLDPAELAKEDQPIFLEIRKEGEGDYQIVGHEGRHRMMALANAGYDRGVPVVLVNRPYGAVQNAEPVEDAYLRRQSFGDRQGRKGIFVQLMVPISWKYKKELLDQFGGEADVKFSLRAKGEPVTRENVVGAMTLAQQKEPYMNCQLCVQMATGVSKLRELPKVNTAKIGDIYTFNETKNMASHYAVDVGNGDVAEVEAWGEEVRVVPLSEVVAEYDEPSAIRRPPETAYTGEALTGGLRRAEQDREESKVSLRVPKQNLRSQIPAATLTRMDATVAFREERTFPQRIMDAISPRSFSWFREQAINRYEYLAKLDRAYVAKMGGVKLLADQSAEAAALMSDLGAGLSASAFGVHDRVGGIPVFRNGVVKISNENNTVKGPLAIFAPLAKYGDPEIYRLFEFVVTVKRGSRFSAQGKPTPFQPGDLTKARALETQFPEFVTIQKEWTKYNDGLVKFMRDTGVITPAAAAEWTQHGDYFPMYKYFEGDEVTGPKVFSSIANVSVPKKYKGDNQPLGDFFENVVRNTQAAIQAGIKNVAAQRATKVALSVKEVVPLKRKPKKMTPEVYRVLENGQEKYYAAQDMMMISALKSLNIPDFPFIGVVAGPANLLRNLVTKTPDFMAANMLRDSVAAWVSSGKNITPVISTLINFGKAIGEKSPELNALRNAGVLGGYDYAQGVQTTAQTFAKDLRKIGGGRTAMEKLTSPATSLWGALEKGSAASDAATRMEIYKKVLAETGNEAEALFQALEVMNFNRKGKSGVIRVLTAAVPFLNARIQGLDVLYRAGIRPLFAGDATAQEKARAKTFWIRGSSLMALSAMYWAMTHDDDEYKRQEQEVRDNYWLLPSMGVKIPIPFEIGVMFKVLPERVMEYSMGDDTGQDFARAMGRHLRSTFAFNPIPQTIVPIVEATTNKSFFTGRPILGQGMEDIAPQFQATPATSKTATELANFYNSIISFLPAPVAKELQASPVILEHLIQGYTGTMGMYAMQTMDYIVSANSEVPNASKRFEQMPVIKRFLVDPQARGTVTAFYDMKNAVDQMTRTANYLERTMNFEDQTKFVQDNIKVLATKEYVSDLEKTMKEFRDQKLMIRSSTMDAETKRSMLDMVEQMELQLTANIRTLRKQLSQ